MVKESLVWQIQRRTTTETNENVLTLNNSIFTPRQKKDKRF
jgi:hypothetical protein